MDTNQSMSNGQRAREFYLPATAVLSRVPGRVERFVTTRLADRGVPTSRERGSQPIREFYLPGTAILSAVPSRVERFVSERLSDHDPAGRVAAVTEHVREFYLPATLRR